MSRRLAPRPCSSPGSPWPLLASARGARWPPATTSAATSARCFATTRGRSTAALLAIVGLVFLLNRRFTDLAVFFVAAILVGWLVFSPDQVADAARAIGERVLP